MARGVGTWDECRQLSLPQITAALAACDRRDADLGITTLKTVHAALAPLLAGDKGAPEFERCLSSLKAIIDPPSAEETRKNGVFAKLLAIATKPLK